MDWQRYQQYYLRLDELGFSLDISRMRFDGAWLVGMEDRIQQAFDEMRLLERGAIANPDEGRMVGHYWLRAPERAPTPELQAEIRATVERVKQFAVSIHGARRYTDLLLIGIGGSALGPMLLAVALGHPVRDKMTPHFFDNTDPDGMERLLAGLNGRLEKTLVLVASKSGGTPETANGMKVAEVAWREADLPFAAHAVAITMPGSKLDRLAKEQDWLARFPMFDWVGGRTSVMSAVGLLPAALQGFDIDALLAGAAAMDEATRRLVTASNPAALLALMWYRASGGAGHKDMIVLPYKDRLLLFSRYLQQLVMESLGKRLDLNGQRVDQGLAVYGNKGSTDQHAYVQQLRDGVDNFFVTFLRVLESGGDPVEVEPGVTAGDYLHHFLVGTREALTGNQRESMTITVERVDARTLGALIALFERAVGFYAILVNINAYHQPGVEAGKKAAAAVLELQDQVMRALGAEPRTAAGIAAALGEPDSVEKVWLVLEHLAANGRARQQGFAPDSARFASQ